MRRDLARLVIMAETVKDSELGKLRTLAQDRRRLETQISILDEAHDRIRQQETPDPAFLSGAGTRWESWASDERQRLFAQAAQAAAKAEAQKVCTVRALGRASALAKLQDARRLARKP